MDDRGSMSSRGSKKSRGSLTKASSGRRSRTSRPWTTRDALVRRAREAVLRLAMLKWEDEKHAVDDSSRRFGMRSPRFGARCRERRVSYETLLTVSHSPSKIDTIMTRRSTRAPPR